MPPRPRRALVLAAAAVAALLAAACGRDAGAGEGGRWLPLVDPTHRPDVLVESRRLAPPPTLDGNRFLLGWTGWREDGELVLWSEAAIRDRGVVRFEVTTLDPRPRTLVLDVETLRGPRGSFTRVAAPVPVEVRARRCLASAEGCRRTAQLPPEGRFEVELPLLPTGRASVDLVVPADVHLKVHDGGLRQALPAGDVELPTPADDDGDDGDGAGAVRVAGWAAVDFVRRLSGPATLRGVFEPPADPVPGATHELWVETEGEAPARLFAWSADDTLDRWRGARELDLPVPGDGSRYVRVRLVARGDGGAAAWRDLGIRAAPAPAPPAAAPEPPRLVVLYVLDALRADRATRELMPGYRRLAREGVLFTEHESVAPNTRPAIHALLNGRTPMSPRGLRQRDPRPLPAALRDAGYRTALFSDNGNVSPAWGMDRGFDDVVMGWKFSDTPWGAYNNSSERMQDAALQWLDRLPEDQRAFVYLHVLNPHNPYAPPGRDLQGPVPASIDGTTKTLMRIRDRRRSLDRAEREGLRELYDGSVRYADRRLTRISRELAARYAPGEVLLVVTSDHGEELFDHGGVLHGYTLFQEQLAVPLLFWWPGRLAPRVVRTPTDHLDLHETLRELVGADPSPCRGELGRGDSFAPLLVADAAGDDDDVRLSAAGSLAGGIFSARRDDWKLIWAPRTGTGWGQGQRLGRRRNPEAVYDLARDPGETTNLAGDDHLAVAWLRSRLRAWVDAELAAERGAATERVELDDDTRAQLRALGYLDD